MRVAVGPGADRADIPRLAGRHVTRTSLLQRLERLAPLSFLRALPGTGRTSLAAEWATAHLRDGAEVVWWTGEQHEASFPHVLHEALHDAGTRRVVVVVDDADTLDDPPVLDELCRLVRQAPALYVLLCSGTVHPLEAMATQGDLPTTVLVGSDLSLSADELVAFATSWGHNVTPERATELVELTGGWLTPTKLVLDRTPSPTAPFVVTAAQQFFEERVLPVVANEVPLDLVARLSLAGDLSEALAADLLTTEESGAPTLLVLLEFLEGLGLLESLAPDDDGRLWRFQPLAARLLPILPAVAARRHARDAHRVIAESLVRRAVPASEGRALLHARSGEHWAVLARLWSTDSIRLVLDHPAEVTVAYQPFPPAAARAHPILVMAASYVTSITVDVEPPRPGGISLPGHAMTASNLDLSRYTSLDEQLLVVSATVVAWRRRGRLAEAQAVVAGFERVLDRHSHLLPGVEAEPLNLAVYDLHRAHNALSAGDTQGGMRLLLRAHAVARTSPASAVFASGVAGVLALMHALLGERTETTAWLDSREDAGPTDHPLARWLNAPAHLAGACLLLDRLDVEGAAERITSSGGLRSAGDSWPQALWVLARHALLSGRPRALLAQLEQQTGPWTGVALSPVQRAFVQRCTADLNLALGRLNRTHRVLQESRARPFVLAVPRARLALVTGDHARARSIAGSFLRHRSVISRDVMELLMIKAAAALAMGDTAMAVEHTVQAQVLAARSGNVDHLLGVPPTACAELLDLAEVRLGDDVLARLARLGPVYPESGELVALTPREQAVLELLAEDVTLVDIAAHLTVSTNTVKKQTVSIYAKLGVHERGEALMRAAGLGLLPEPPESPGASTPPLRDAAP